MLVDLGFFFTISQVKYLIIRVIAFADKIFIKTLLKLENHVNVHGFYLIIFSNKNK